MHLFLQHFRPFPYKFFLFTFGEKKKSKLYYYSNEMHLPRRRPSGLTETLQLSNNELALLLGLKRQTPHTTWKTFSAPSSYRECNSSCIVPSNPRVSACITTAMLCYKALRLWQWTTGTQLSWSVAKGVALRNQGQASLCLYFAPAQKSPLCKAHRHIRLQCLKH